jgi:hypothetical protein
MLFARHGCIGAERRRGGARRGEENIAAASVATVQPAGLPFGFADNPWRTGAGCGFGAAPARVHGILP